MNFIKSLPFNLTSAQQRAINEILNDLNSQKPMQRLLQGDVGSGKTVVATIMLLAAIENGYQAAIMAPTEILAQQHYNNMFKWLNPLGIRVELFLGSNGKKQRRISETNLRNGQVDIAIGTHALIQESIDFANLGAVVIDEQHRFGVKQRLALRKKSQNPQVLTMTATPIPRTLAITLNGDLDLTIIDELPKGRKPILTTMTNSRKQISDLIRREVNEGRQAYIVYPLIDESETLSAKAATKENNNLQLLIKFNNTNYKFNIKTPDGKNLENNLRNNQVIRFKIDSVSLANAGITTILNGINETAYSMRVYACRDTEPNIDFSDIDFNYCYGDRLHVYRNGVRLFENLDYVLNSNSIMLFVRPELGERLVFESYGVNNILNAAGSTDYVIGDLDAAISNIRGGDSGVDIE